jgi:long-chain fatty acid transport protein
MKAFTLWAMMAFSLAQPAFSGGLYLYETGIPDLSAAFAGLAARAEDASTAFSNPAGMTRLTGMQILAGIQPLIIQADFDPGPGTTEDGGDGDDAGGVIPAGGVYAVFDTAGECKAGLSLNSFAGLGLDYEDDWAGRYYVQDTGLTTFAVSPSIGFNVSDRLSLGAAVHFVYGSTATKAAVNNVLDTLPDGSLEIEDTAFGIGGRVGALMEATDSLRFGLVYQSPIQLDFSDEPGFEDLGPGLSFLASRAFDTVDLDMTLPQQVMASVFFKASDRLDLMANIGWQDWSEFGQDIVTVHTAGQSELTTDIDYDDTWHFAAGVRYALTPKWRVSAGVAYDSSMASDDVRSPSLPVDRTWRYAGGVHCAWSEVLELDLGYEYIDTGSAEFDVERGPLAGRLQGDYAPNAIHAVNLSVAYRF